MKTVAFDVGSPDDLECFDAQLNGGQITRDGTCWNVELVGAHFAPGIDPLGKRFYRLTSTASLDWDHGSNERFVP